MGHEQERGAVGHDLADPAEALLLEVGVPDGQDLVDEKDVGIEVGSDGEAEADLHAARVVLHLAVDGVRDLGELDDGVEALVDVAARQAEEAAEHVDVLSATQDGVDAPAHLEEGANPPVGLAATGRLVHAAADHLEHRGLSRAVDADERHRPARLQLEVDVLQDPPVVAPASSRRRPTLATWSRRVGRPRSDRKRFHTCSTMIVPSADVGKVHLEALEETVPDDEIDRQALTAARPSNGQSGDRPWSAVRRTLSMTGPRGLKTE